ncbi:MAG: RsmD family RNA methyltransferase, partial [Clostridia bacterium]|nr:RsmD family RNA methyltransferase [Clostridia bacterium]
LDYRQCLASGQKYDLIFIDPPYASDAGISALEIIGDSGLLSENAIAVFERDKPFTQEIKGLTAYDERKYGKTYITFFKADGV